MNKTLAGHITRLVTVILSLFFIVLAVCVLIYKRQDMLKQFENDKIMNLNLISTSISEPLYTYNKAALGSITHSFLNSWDESIQKIDVVDQNNEIILSNHGLNFNSLPENSLSSKSQVIFYDGKNIGKITIVFSDTNIKSELTKWSIGFILYVLFAAILLFIFFHTAFNRLLTNPLKTLLSELSKLRKNDYSAKLIGNFRFELGAIAQDFNEAIEGIRLRDKRINEYAESLEHMVEKRTIERDEQTWKAISAARLASIGEMSASIAHEINNPLAVIYTLSGQLNKKFDQKKEEFHDEIEKLLKIKSMILRIQKIIDGIKKFSRDGSTESMNHFSLNNFLESIKDLTNYKLLSSSIELKVENETLLTEAFGQELQLSQVMINLINNSVDAISELEGDKFINIKVYEANNNLYFRVIDSGKGIPLPVREKMLSPFFTTKSQGKGTGLGLSLSRDIIKKHNGDFYYVEGLENTAFEFYIPIKD